MSDQARNVVRWISELEGRTDLLEFVDDVITGPMVPSGTLLLIAPQPLLPLDLNVMSSPSALHYER